MAAKSDGNGELESFVARISNRMDERKEVDDDIKSIYLEAMAQGFRPKALKSAVKIFRMSGENRPAAIAMLETLDQYLSALGLLSDLPLGRTAIARQFGHDRSVHPSTQP